MSDIELAISERAIEATFNAFIKNFSLPLKHTGDPYTSHFAVTYDVLGRFTEGRLSLTNGVIHVDQLEMYWDKLDFDFLISIDKIVIGGFCILDVPFAGCILRFPEFDVFGGHPDISVPINLSGFLVSEATVHGTPTPQPYPNPAYDPKKTYLDNEIAGASNAWQICFVPTFIDFQIVDVAGTLKYFIASRVEQFIINLLARFLPGFMVDIIRAILGPVINLIVDLLGIADTMLTWLQDLFVAMIWAIFRDQLQKWIAKLMPPLISLENPYPIIKPPPHSSLIPVKVPISDLKIAIAPSEISLTLGIGDLV